MTRIQPHANVREIRALARFASVDIDAHAIYSGRTEKPRTKLRKMAIINRATGKSARVEDVRREMRGILADADTSGPKFNAQGGSDK